MDKKTKTMQGIQKAGPRIAPAVALLLLGDSAYAQIVVETDSEDGDLNIVSEPSTLGLLAAGAAVGGVVAYIRNKRHK